MRKKGCKNLNGAEPWKEYGLTKGAYYNRMRKGIPLDATVKRGRKATGVEKKTGKKHLSIRELKKIFGPVRKETGRFSGRTYTNSEERLSQIREKYKNGVTEAILDEVLRF
jgi:hypothetical protein